MKRSSLLYILWILLFAACAGLGFVEASGSTGRWILTAVSLLFFLPPFMLLREGEKWRRRILRISGASLALTVILIWASILTADAGDTVEALLHGLLVIVSAPMFAAGWWVLSLFLWACLFFAALRRKKGKEAA